MKKIIITLIIAICVISSFAGQKRVKSDDLQYKVQKLIQEKTPENTSLEIEYLPESIMVPDTNFTVDFGSEFNPGKNRGLLKLTGKDWDISIFWSYRAKILRKVFITKHTLIKGQRIKSEDLLIVDQWVSEGKLPESIDEIAGKTAKNSIPTDALIRTKDLSKSYDVIPNTEVDAIYKNGSINLVTKATALRRATIGEIISVRINGKILKAEVVSQNKVVIQ